MYFYYRAQKQVRVTRSKYLYYAIINRVGGLARAIPGSCINTITSSIRLCMVSNTITTSSTFYKWCIKYNLRK